MTAPSTQPPETAPAMSPEELSASFAPGGCGADRFVETTVAVATSSPAASQVYSVIRAAENGGGVLLGFGNYAGDVLHFGQAAERLRAEGVDVRIVAVSDDIASGPADRHEERRGVAGDLVVFKVAGAAASHLGAYSRIPQSWKPLAGESNLLGRCCDSSNLPFNRWWSSRRQ